MKFVVSFCKTSLPVIVSSSYFSTTNTTGIRLVSCLSDRTPSELFLYLRLSPCSGWYLSVFDGYDILHY